MFRREASKAGRAILSMVDGHQKTELLRNEHWLRKLLEIRTMLKVRVNCLLKKIHLKISRVGEPNQSKPSFQSEMSRWRIGTFEMFKRSFAIWHGMLVVYSINI